MNWFIKILVFHSSEVGRAFFACVLGRAFRVRVGRAFPLLYVRVVGMRA